jgi:hypothetical protein
MIGSPGVGVMLPDFVGGGEGMFCRIFCLAGCPVHNGNRYDGEWRDNKRNGHGVATLARGRRYDGAWRDNKANGAGQLTLAHGQVYSGFWVEGCVRDGPRRPAIGVVRLSCPR